MNQLRNPHLQLFGLILMLALLACTCSDLQPAGPAESVLISTEAAVPLTALPAPTSAPVATAVDGIEAPAGNLDWGAAAPLYGQIALDPNFDPNPHFVEDIWAGGRLNVTDLRLGEDCIGNVESAPNYRVIWSGSGVELDIWFTAEIEGDDAILIVRDPDGLWWCNDDDNGKNPKVEIENAPAGEYNIWLGNWEFDFVIQGVLYFEEDLD